MRVNAVVLVITMKPLKIVRLVTVMVRCIVLVVMLGATNQHSHLGYANPGMMHIPAVMVVVEIDHDQEVWELVKYGNVVRDLKIMMLVML
jgi:hypothetical protein